MRARDDGIFVAEDEEEFPMAQFTVGRGGSGDDVAEFDPIAMLVRGGAVGDGVDEAVREALVVGELPLDDGLDIERLGSGLGGFGRGVRIAGADAEESSHEPFQIRRGDP